MRMSTMFMINSILAVLFGAAFIAVPEPVLSIYGLTSDAAGFTFMRLIGAAFIGIAVMTWLARHSSFEAQYPIAMGQLVHMTTGFLITLILKLTMSLGNMMVWSTVGLYLLIALGFAYCLFMKAPARTRA